MLQGVGVTIGGQSAYLDYVSPTQVNVQVPAGLASGVSVPMVLSYGGQSSDPYPLTIMPSLPGLLAPATFVVNGKQYVAALHSSDYSFVGNGHIPNITNTPAKPGETILLFGIGFGPVDSGVPTAGQIVTASNSITSPVRIFFGPSEGSFQYRGLAPGFVGLYQFNVVVPTTSSGDVPLTMTVGQSGLLQKLFISLSN